MRKLTTLIALAFATLLLASACGDGGPSAGPGDKIAFTSCHPEPPDDPDTSYHVCNIYVVNADGSDLARLTDLAAFNAENANPYAVWSPDASRIAFAFPQVFDSDIYVMNTDGSGETNLTNSSADDRYPVWSPDGTQLSFVSDDGLYVINADGSGLTRQELPFEGRSPDGSRFAFASDREGNAEIYVMDADGSDLANLTNDPDWDDTPLWSPDGSRIAFLSDRDRPAMGPSEIYVMNADGSTVKRLTTGSLPGEGPPFRQREATPWKCPTRRRRRRSRSH